MPRRPIIGIPLQSYPAVPGERPALWGIGQSYVEVLARHGAIPWLVPPLTDDPAAIRSIFERIDGLLLAGGSDIHPNRYGELVRPECGPIDPNRDSVEIELVRQTVEANRPVLGICRGLQLMNVARGGTLYQDIAAQVPAALKHDYTARQGHLDRTGSPHDVTVKAGTRLAGILGTNGFPVNSIHHQAVKDLGRDLVATAYAPDGVVEALELPSHPFFLGVQWHPEDLLDSQPSMAALFAAFVSAAGNRV
jgi:putative glutamine amidotransferase